MISFLSIRYELSGIDASYQADIAGGRSKLLGRNYWGYWKETNIKEGDEE